LVHANGVAFHSKYRKTTMSIDDHLRRLQTAKASLARATLRGERLPPQEELLIAEDPTAANEYSLLFFGGGRLPDDMHDRLQTIGLLRHLGPKWNNAASDAWDDYFARVAATGPPREFLSASRKS